MVAQARSSQQTLDLRPPSEVMRLARMGSFHPMRLSFSRQLIRRMSGEGWQIDTPVFELDENGFGVVVIRAQAGAGGTGTGAAGTETAEDTETQAGGQVFSLVAYSDDLPPARRSDRVIADAWDATFTLYDGTPDAEAIEAMRPHVMAQEAGRHHARQLTLSRANKSVRIFDHVVGRLAAGKQPDADMVNRIGYLMRTTAVYGNGKFGISDRGRFKDRPGLAAPFAAEMLTVYLIRHFAFVLVAHLAKCRGGEAAVGLAPHLGRHLGIGNATGLGMAPFLVNHQVLLHKWMAVRETAYGRVRGIRFLDESTRHHIRRLVERGGRYAAQWRVADAIQMARITRLEEDISHIKTWVEDEGLMGGDYPLNHLADRAAGLSLEAEEMLLSILIEPFGGLVDGLAEDMAADETPPFDAAMTVADMREAMAQHYDWALALDLDGREESALFWYTSATKLEPRLGKRFEEEGAECAYPFDIPHQIKAAYADLAAAKDDMLSAAFMMAYPQHRFILRRVMETASHPYGEIRDNLVAARTRPIDMLRCKLSFFGASKFDPKSDLWTRITLFQGAPLAHELSHDDADDWLFPALAPTLAPTFAP